MSTGGSKIRREDRILKLKTPLLFAHRGGAGEVPESTEEAFRHAVKHGSDVLELDIRLTRDGEIVVWHGPELEAAFRKVRGKNQRYSKRDVIGDFRWRDLRNKVWVLHPKPNDKDKPRFKDTDERRLLLLSDFFALVDKLDDKLPKGRTLPVNIELKAPSGKADRWTKKHLNTLLDLVDEQSKRRTIILASLGLRRLKRLRKRMVQRGVCHPTNLALIEQLAYSEYMKLHFFRFGLSVGDWFVREKKSLVNIAFETSHALLSKKLVREVRQKGGSLYVFLTGFPGASGIDDEEPKDLEELLFKLLDTGVDGVMTDYPEKVGRLIKEWREKTG